MKGQLDQMDAQQQQSADGLPNIFGVTQQQQSPPSLGQLSGSISPSALTQLKPVTVHAHASDKPGSGTPPQPEESRQTAQQVQETAAKQHKIKLMKLKKRLKLLK